MAIEKGNKRIINAWVFYDWANSVYPLVITTAIFPPFFEAVTNPDEKAKPMVDFLGFSIRNTQVYEIVIATSFLFVVLLSPILSGIADYSGNKKFFLKLFCYMGSLSCAAFFFFDPDQLELSMFPVMMASIGFWGSLVFYNAYLPEIAEPKDQDRISARGFSMGYLGSSILLISCLALIMVAEMPARWCFVLVALWWVGFSQITYRRLPTLGPKERNDSSVYTKGFEELRSVWKEVKKNGQLKAYLRAFFLYSMGVQTLLLLAVLFAKTEIRDMPEAGLIISVLVIQFVAIAGSRLFAFSSGRYGNIFTLKIAILIWVIVCIAAYFTYTALQFYFLAAAVGLIMGGIQSLSRSTYSKMLPDTRDHASYFSFYDVTEKVALIFGMLSFAYIEGVYGDMRSSTLLLMSFFILGLGGLFFVKELKKA